MNIVKKLSLASSLLLSMAMPAMADVFINSPTNGSAVASTFPLSAYSSPCSSQNTVAMGYSIDDSSSTTLVSGASITTSVSAPGGWHTLHVKSWGSSGASCVTNVSINVSASATAASTSSAIPSYAAAVTDIQTLGSWTQTHDPASGGSSNGAMAMANNPSRSGHARSFYTTFNYYGGERYMATFGDEASSTNFVYDGWIYIANYAQNIANIEMDLNQTMQNGQTAIFGFQCDGWSHTWDYTVNRGTPTSPSDQWAHSSQYCDPRTWSVNTWHHIQIAYSRDTSGNVTYKTVTLDGNQQNIWATVNSAYALGWGPVLLTNFQVDGYLSGSGSSLVYLDNLTVYHW